MLLNNRVALITGAASGIGEQIAYAFAAAGAKVAIADLDRDKVRRTVDDMRALGRPAIGVIMDVTNEEEVESGVATAVKAALFLASFKTNALTGQSLVVSHGWSMQ